MVPHRERHDAVGYNRLEPGHRRAEREGPPADGQERGKKTHTDSLRSFGRCASEKRAMVSQAMSRPVPTAQFKRENFWPLAGGNYSPGDHRRCALLLAKATRQKRTSVKCVRRRRRTDATTA